MPRYLVLVVVLLWIAFNSSAQDSPPISNVETVLSAPAELSKLLSKQQSAIQTNVDRQTDKYFERLLHQEKKLQRKLKGRYSGLADSIQLGSDSLYNSFKQKLSSDQSVTRLPSAYSGKIDSMVTAINFLKSNPAFSALHSAEFEKLTKQYSDLSLQLNKAEHLKQLVQKRKEFLKEKLANVPLGKAWSKYQKQAIYYQQQLEEYKKALQDPHLLEARALQLLSQVPTFRKFFDKYSVLGTMFRLPGQVEDMNPSTVLNGLQTRDAVLANITDRMGTAANAQQAITAGIKEGQSAIESIKSKLDNVLASGESLDMPGFKPNHQRNKSFLKRLELGTNIQSTRSTNFFPVTTDLGFSLGYKLSGQSIIGVGAAYKMGWGQDYKHIKITHEGVGFRVFTDWKPTSLLGGKNKLLSGLWVTGGGEWNYREQFQQLSILNDFSQWQQSVLLGLQKKQQVGKYKANVSVLYDFLWESHVPQTQPILFRVGYTLK